MHQIWILAVKAKNWEQTDLALHCAGLLVYSISYEQHPVHAASRAVQFETYVADLVVCLCSYYINPLAWTLYGIIVTQLGDETNVVRYTSDVLI